MSNSKHNVAILFFTTGTTPSYYIGNIDAVRIVAECAARLAYDPTITAQVFAEDGTLVARAETDGRLDGRWVPINNARMSHDAAALYDALWDKHSLFRTAYRERCTQYATFRNR